MVATAVAAVVVGIALFAVAVKVMGNQSVQRQATDFREFDVGSAAQRAAAVDRDRTPLLFPDPLERDREIYVQHLGAKSWVAFEARAPGAARNCVLRWRVAEQSFGDPCTGAVYPRDGTGLTSYPARVDKDGRLLVDLRSPAHPVPQTQPGAA